MPGHLRFKPDDESPHEAQIIAFVPRAGADKDTRPAPQSAGEARDAPPPAAIIPARKTRPPDLPPNLAGRAREMRAQDTAAVETRNLATFEHLDATPDNYRHRMIANGVGFVAALMVALIGIWLADKMAELRHDQDCVLMRLQSCAPATARLLP